MNKEELLKETKKLYDTAFANWQRTTNNLSSKYSDGESDGIMMVYQLIKELEEPEVTEEQAWSKIAEGTLKTGEELKEMYGRWLEMNWSDTQILEVSQEVAKWFKINEHSLWRSIQNIIRYPKYHRHYKTAHAKFEEWFEKTEDAVEILFRMKNGYTVEKEPLYRVPLGIKRSGEYPVHLFKGSEGVDIDWSRMNHVEDEEFAHLYLFTESEIKAVNPNYWAFAEPVKE